LSGISPDDHPQFRSIDHALLVNNVTGLARAARDLGVPTLLTTVGASGGPLRDPILQQISEVFPDQEPIDRVSTNAWEDIKPDYTTAEREAVTPGLAVRGGGVGLSLEYLLANIPTPASAA
jgi:nicotinamidase-related amidase